MIETKEVLARVKHLEIRTRKAVDEFTAGGYRSVFKGKGIEFDEVREYISGDDVRDIDWNVTARMNSPYVKKYIEERQLNVLILVDVSASIAAGGAGLRKRRLATELVALLSFSAIRNGDRVGLILFSDEEELHLSPRKGRRHGLRLVREMVVHEAHSSGTDISCALEVLMRSNYRRSIVFVISDFVDSDFEQSLKLASEKHDLVACRLVDSLDATLVRGALLFVEDAETGEQIPVRVTESVADEYARGAAARFEEVRKRIIRAGTELIDFNTDGDLVAQLMGFFRRRERRMAHHHRR